MFASIGMSTLSQEPGVPCGLQFVASPHDDPSPMPVQLKDVPEQLCAATGLADAGIAANTPTVQAAENASTPIRAPQDIRWYFVVRIATSDKPSRGAGSQPMSSSIAY
jgi:hypothetical protein